MRPTAAGRPVSYVPEQLIDGKLNTAWRCNGNGIGQVVDLHASRRNHASLRSAW